MTNHPSDPNWVPDDIFGPLGSRELAGTDDDPLLRIWDEVAPAADAEVIPPPSSPHFANLPYGNMNGQGEAGLELDLGTITHLITGHHAHPRSVIRELYLDYGDEELARIFDAAVALLLKLSQDEQEICSWGDRDTDFTTGRTTTLWAALDTAMIWERG